VIPRDFKRALPPVGGRALRSGPTLTIGFALVIAALASSAYAVPAPTVFLLITVVYAAALGGWKAGLASALVAMFYLAWLVTDAGRAAQYAPLNRTFLTVGAVGLPLALLAGCILHQYLQRERGRDWEASATQAFDAGGTEAKVESDRRFRALVEQVQDYAIFMMDAHGRHTTWNEGVRRLLGYDEAEFLALSGGALFTPEDRERGEFERELRTAGEQGRASDDRWLVRRDGTRFWASGTTTRLDSAGGGLAGFSKVFRDLTEEQDAQGRLRDSETRLRVALHAARMGIWRWHLPTNTQRVDSSMARLLGLGDGEVVESYEQFRQHIHPDDRERVDSAFHHAAHKGGEMHVEFRVVWPDGTVRWLADHGEAVLDERGEPEFVTGAAIDVTERKTAEERLAHAQRMDAVGHLAGGVAHEINNMMTAVLGFSTLLLDTMGDDPRVADIRQIHRAADRAATITRQLLAFSRRQLLRPQVLNVNKLVRGMEHMLRRVLGEDKVVKIELTKEAGNVRADPGQLEQVLLNLTLNARDAMPLGGTFTITTENVRFGDRDQGPMEDELPAGHYVRINVVDTGYGMDAPTRARVFEPFFTTKPVGQGTGLGLATAFGIVRQSGGTVRLQSHPGKGTIFSIYLPLVDDEPVVQSDSRAVNRGARATGVVLVVEDEEMVRTFTCRVLTAHGYRCIEASNAEEALEIVTTRGDGLNAVVSDVVMPGMSGGMLAERLAELRPELPVLFTSAYTGEEVVRRGLIHADAQFLQKPFAPQLLVARLQNLTGESAPPARRSGEARSVER
jgi:two-component system, cell cycle sensor histidine kinase and response regulator CckA